MCYSTISANIFFSDFHIVTVSLNLCTYFPTIFKTLIKKKKKKSLVFPSGFMFSINYLN